jgi:hypothetical protein
MTTKTKGRSGWHQATPNTSHTCNRTVIASRVKALVVTLALWRVLPVRLAEWIIIKGGLRND